MSLLSQPTQLENAIGSCSGSVIALIGSGALGVECRSRPRGRSPFRSGSGSRRRRCVSTTQPTSRPGSFAGLNRYKGRDGALDEDTPPSCTDQFSSIIAFWIASWTVIFGVAAQTFRIF